MKTSYFAKYKENDGISIAISSPYWFKGSLYPALYPKWTFLSRYLRSKKTKEDQKIYIKEYYTQVLSKLDPERVLKDLDNRVLLCWEKKGDFCHRRLVAYWIEESILGAEVPEI